MPRARRRGETLPLFSPTVTIEGDEVRAALPEGAAAVALMHGYRFTEHERRIGEICAAIGFDQVSLSHATSPLIKLVSRGDTTVVDAYLSPILRRYVDRVADELGADTDGGPQLMFMQSNGGLTATPGEKLAPASVE